MAGVKIILLLADTGKYFPSSLFCKNSTFSIFLAHLKAHCHRIITLSGWRGPQETSSPDLTLNSWPGYSEFFLKTSKVRKIAQASPSLWDNLLYSLYPLWTSTVSPCAHCLLSTCHRLLRRAQLCLHNDAAGTGGWCQVPLQSHPY